MRIPLATNFVCLSVIMLQFRVFTIDFEIISKFLGNLTENPLRFDNVSIQEYLRDEIFYSSYV